MTEIVKVQRPISHNAGIEFWLIYGKGRSRMEECDVRRLPAEVITAMGGDFKAYFDAEWVKGTGWQIGKRRAKMENW